MQERDAHWPILWAAGWDWPCFAKGSLRPEAGGERRACPALVPPQAFGLPREGSGLHLDPSLGAAVWGCWGRGRRRRPAWGVRSVRGAVGGARRGCRGFAGLEAAAQAVPSRAARPPVPCGLSGSAGLGGLLGLASPTLEGHESFPGAGAPRAFASILRTERRGRVAARGRGAEAGGRDGESRGARGHANSQPRGWWASASRALTFPQGFAPGLCC